MNLPKEVITDFLEQFEMFSQITLVSGAGCSLVKYGPSKVIKFFECNGYGYYLCPVYRNLTKMCWFDLDAHSGSEQEKQESLQLCTKLTQELLALGATPEISESQIGRGGYHIVMWFEKPQSVGYVYGALSGFAAHLGILDRIEIGPQYGKKIRPWFMSCGEKKVGQLITPGKRMTDLSCLNKFRVQIKNSYAFRCLVSQVGDLNIETLIPDGTTLKRNAAILKLVARGKKLSMTDEQIMKFSEDMYNHPNAKVKDSLETHLKETHRAITNYKIPSWKPFWKNVPPNLPVQDLLLLIDRYAKKVGFKDLLIPVANIMAYYNLTKTTAWRRIREWVDEDLLVVVESGHGFQRPATRYRLGKNLIQFKQAG
jgi:hypothetical protein